MSGLTDRLRQVAGQATPGPWQDDGPWWHDMDDPVHVVTTHLDRSAIAMMPPFEHLNEAADRRNETAAYIATFDPVLVGAMLDVIDLAGCPLNDVRMKRALARFREVSG